MKRKFRFLTLIIMSLAAVVLSACGGVSAPLDTACTDTIVEKTTEVETDNQEQITPFDGDVVASSSEESEVAAEPTVQKKQTNGGKTSYGNRETLYISTYGANGKVWGHVTMNGNTGRGTIHDDDENSYSITVTRHGGELFGTDQNGRQYVFRM